MGHISRCSRVLACVAGCGVVLVVGVLLLRLVLSSFTIFGNAATPISDGVAAPLDVSFTNSYDFPISVTGLRVSVRHVSAPHADGAHPCTASDFVVDQLPSTVRIIVGAHATSSLSRLHLPGTAWPRVSLLSSSADKQACQGASLTLAYSASRKVRIL